MQQFKGFKPEAMQRIAGTLGYQGDMSNFNDYLNQNPDKMQQMGMYQQKALQMVNGGMVQNFANGGDVDYRTYYDQKGNVQNLDIDNLLKQPAQQAQQGVGAVLKQDGSIDNTAMMKQKQQAQQQPVQLPKDKLQPQPIQPVDPRDPVPAQGLRRVDTLAGAKDKLQPQPIKPEPQPQPFYSDASMKALNMSVGKEEVDLRYDINGDGKVTSQDALAIAKEGKEFSIPEEGKYPIDDEPSRGIPPIDELVPNPPTLPELPKGFDEFAKTFADNASKAIDPNGKMGAEFKAMFASNKFPKDLTDYTVTGKSKNWVVTYGDGTVLNSQFVNEASLKNALDTSVPMSINDFKESEILKPYNKELEEYKVDVKIYKDYVSDTTTTGVTSDIENIEKEYTAASDAVDQKKIELRRLQKLAEDNPDNTYYAELVDEKVEQLADDVERVADLEETYQSTLRTVKDITKGRFDAKVDDPDFAISEEKGTKVIADKIKVDDNQFIKDGTGQIDSVAQGDTTDAKAFDAGGPDTVTAGTYDGQKVTAAAEKKLEDLKAQTQEGLSREVVGQTDTIRAEGQADDAIKVAADRIERAVNPTDLEVTDKQLAEAKGKDLKAIEANIAVSDRLKKIVAQTSVVDPKELPDPAKISDSIMRSVQAMKETDTGLSDETTDYIAAKMEAFTVSSGTLAVAMQGDVTAQATVQGQLSSLMKSFDNGTPAWAAGAIRAANEAMLSRGMAASSMAAAAIVQAAMESALPIASQDAQVYAAMGMANLDNLQKVSLANAAAQQGLSLQNLNNEQQMNLQNSVQAFDLQKQNLSNRQSVELANAQIRSTLQGKVLDNTQQSNIITAARYAEQANINLSNKQQAVLQDNLGSLQTNLADAGAKQQSYITSANLAQALQGQVLSNDQQVAISNAARFSDAANLNFTSDQQEILHNSSLMQSIGLAELNTTQSATLQNAANFASMDMAELSNAQQAQVLNAQNFLQLDLANLSNEQQVALFKAQALQQTLLSDQASVNASEQFNATSETQVEQFNANLKTQVDQFNKAQKTAISQFNSGQDNAMEQFNVAQANAADQFNAQNELVIAQSNATWRREVATADTAAQNRANEINAKSALDIQNQAYDNMWNHYGDQMDNAYTSAESDAERAGDYAIAQLSADTAANAAAAARNADASKSLGALAGTLLTSDLSKGILKGFF